MSEHFHAKSQFDGSKLTLTDGPTPLAPSWRYSVEPQRGQKLLTSVVAKPLPLATQRYEAISSFFPQLAGRGSAQNAASGPFSNNNEVAMQKRTQKGRRRAADPRQGDFLALLEGAIELPVIPEPNHEAGALDIDQEIRRLLNEAIAAGPFQNREALAEAISFHAGRRVTKAMIDCWTGKSRPHAFPTHLIPAFNRALGNTLLLQGIAKASGCAITESADLVEQRLSRLALFIRFAKAEQRRLIAETPLFQGARHG